MMSLTRTMTSPPLYLGAVLPVVSPKPVQVLPSFTPKTDISDAVVQARATGTRFWVLDLGY